MINCKFNGSDDPGWSRPWYCWWGKPHPSSYGCQVGHLHKRMLLMLMMMVISLMMIMMVISYAGMVRGRLPLCWSKLVPICTPPTKKVSSHSDHRQINPKLSTSFIFTNGQSQCKPRRFLNIQYDPLTIAFIIDAHHPPNHQKMLLPPGKTPELLADFVNEQPMKVLLKATFFTNSWIKSHSKLCYDAPKTSLHPPSSFSQQFHNSHSQITSIVAMQLNPRN